MQLPQPLRTFMIVLLLFFCSGATALVYEVLWSKYLTLLFGSTVQAQTVVLAIFMGGLALGNRLFGRRADTSKQPLAIYGYLEMAIGLYAFFFPYLHRAADRVFAVAGSPLLEQGGWLLLLKGVLSALLLLGPTILMGGTLPLLAAWLQKHTADAGRRSARFYSTNSLGAVCGAGLAGFFLISWLGLPTTLQVTGLLNVLVGLVAIGLARRQSAVVSSETSILRIRVTGPNGDGATSASSARLFRWGCVLVTLTGAVSMGLEVLAARCLGMIVGASLQAFAIVLMAFILGIGLGSAVIASRKGEGWPKETATITLVLGAAAWIGLLVFNIENLVVFYARASSGLSSSSVGYLYSQLLTGIFAMIVLGLPAAALGSVLPLWIRVVSAGSDFLGDRVGRLLTWNTLGAVGGVLLTGFVLMPSIGLRGSLAALALTLAGAALLVAVMTGRRVPALAAVGVCGLLIVVATTGTENWRLVLSSGIFRWRDREFNPEKMKNRLKQDRILFYEDAADATVSVEENDRPGFPRQRSLRVNGKPDASTFYDLSTQMLLAYLPLMAKPDSKEVFVLGLGSGITAGATLGYPIERLTIAENCEPVVRAAALFDPWNRGVLKDTRTRICREDARTVLKLSPQRYDIIISEPSNPWAAGVGSVFSREFYETAASRLKPNGVVAQWFHVYEMSDGIVEMVMRTFGSVFPYMEVWDSNSGDIILLGSLDRWKSDRETFAAIFGLPGPAKNLAEIGLTTPEAILARQLASQRTAFAITGPGPIQTDEFPVLEYAAPRALFLGRTAQFLNRFDERTWQQLFASAEKRHLMAAMNPTNLSQVFSGQGKSMNPELQFCVSRHATDHKGRLTPYGGGLGPIGIFEDTNAERLLAPDTAETNRLSRLLFEAEMLMRTDPEKASQAIDAILAVLDSTIRYDRQSAGWSASFYSGFAVQAALATGDRVRAKRALQRGLALEPNSPELQYLARILVGEGVLGPDELPVAQLSAGGRRPS